MITHLRLVNFRSHGDTTVRLGPITLLIGPAGAGKSNIFKALVQLQNSVHRTLAELFPPGLSEFHWVRSRWAKETDPIRFEVGIDHIPEFPGAEARYTLGIAPAPPPAALFVVEESLQRRDQSQSAWAWVFDRQGLRPRPYGEFGTAEPHEPTLLHKVWHRGSDVDFTEPGVRFAKGVAQALSRCAYYHLEASRLKSKGAGQPAEHIDYNGDRLPDFLDWAKSFPDGRQVYDYILRELRELLPGLKDLLVTTVDDKPGMALSFDGHRGYIAAPDLSDGTLFTLGMLCLACGPKRPALLCIEEPETGIHPRRLRWLFDRLMSLAHPSDGQCPTQVLLSSHSPYVVDLFREMRDSVQIVELSGGRSKVSPLHEIQQRLRSDETDGPIGHEWAAGLFEGV